MKKLTWRTEKRKVSDLKPADYNPRKITDKQREDLLASIKEFSEVEPVVINANNKLIGGHQRLSIYLDLGIEEIDVRVPNRKLNDSEEKRLNIRLNKNTGEFDFDKLQDFDPDMLSDLGFDKPELSDIFADAGTEDDDFDEKKAIEKAKKTSIKKGDIFELGDHRLMCGDSTDKDDVEKLMGGQKASVIYCDPPYNIGLDYSKGVGTGGKYQGNYSGKKDSKLDTDYKEFVEATLKNALSFSGKNVHVFYWCDEKYIWLFQTMFSENRIDNKRVCFWVKNNASPTPQIAFNKVYEPCVYGTIGRPYLNNNYRNLNEVMNREVGTGNQLTDDILDIFNLWIVKRDETQGYAHPTQKPITLHEKPLKRCSAPGDVVIDLFGGSGSTLMSCEQLSRKSCLMEQDPIFVQVIIDRWEKYTGEKSKKI